MDLYGPILPPTRATLEAIEGLRPLYAREAYRYGRLRAGELDEGDVDTIHLQDVFEYDQRHGGSKVRELPPREDGSPRMPLGRTTREALQSIGATHLMLVDRTPDDGRPTPLVDPAPSIPIEGSPEGVAPVPKLDPIELGPPIWRMHPSWAAVDQPDAGASAPCALLPLSLRFPLVDLWAVRRPGPALLLYEL